MNDTCCFASDFNSLSAFLKGFAFKLTNDHHKAEDLFQDTALLAYKNKDKYQTGTNLKAWLSTIMRNTFINNFRQKQRQGEVVESAMLYVNEKRTVGNDGEGYLIEGELVSMIDNLEESVKQPFVMAYHGYKYHEISKAMNLPEGTIKSRIFVARKALKNQIKIHFRISEPEEIYFL